MKNASGMGPVGRYAKALGAVALLAVVGCGGAPEDAAPELGQQEQRATYSGDFDGDGTTDQLTTSATGISIYHPSNGTSRFYNFTGSFAVNTTADTDGKPGLEVVVATGTGISVIVDRTGTSRFYPFSGNYQINSVVDTDGKAGADIIVVAKNSSSQGIVIIHDASNSSQYYQFSTNFTITAVCNSDGVAGAELFITTPGTKYILNDRLGNTTTTLQTTC
jgi:hypothetical protein